jgi:flavin prenyltransferase
MSAKRIVLAITGASGAPVGLRVLELLADSGAHVHLILSRHGRAMLVEECALPDQGLERHLLVGRPSVTLHDDDNLAAAPSSGSFPTDGMIICPCSSHTLGTVAAGLGDRLIPRAAHVSLKERRPLIVVHREMPVSTIDLENMLTLSRAGATICPASPGFYMKPQNVGDLVDFVAGRVLDLVGVRHALNVRWTGEDSHAPTDPSRDVSEPRP